MGKKAQKISEALTDSKTAQRDIEDLRKQLQQQRILIQALWGLIKEKLNMGEEEFLQAVTDLETVARNHVKVAQNCPSCARPIQEQKKQCIYCGAAIERTTVF